jgi:hypothetical protein
MNQDLNAETSKNRGERIPGLRATIDAAVQIFHENGVDLILAADKWARGERLRLDSLGAQEFDELCSNGCHPIALAGSLFISECMPFLTLSLRNVLGRVDERPRSAKKLRDAAEVLQKFAPEKLDRLQERMSKRNPDAPVSLYALVRGLEFYAKFFEIAEALSREADIKSKNDLPRFIVTDYVHCASGHWHDNAVSILLQGDSDDVYDEVAHRVWRNRNFRRLRGRYSFLSELLLELQFLLRERTEP